MIKRGLLRRWKGLQRFINSVFKFAYCRCQTPTIHALAREPKR
ncbi:hypothetical protein [Candidatus Enterovibrio altilux]|nr:hypothetical protein [Candidatus Enterovibrio luxaltus]